MSDKNVRTTKSAAPARPEWWRILPEAEKAVIRDVLNALRSLKRSQQGQVAVAARKWERSLGCFIKCQLMSGERGGRYRRSR